MSNRTFLSRSVVVGPRMLAAAAAVSVPLALESCAREPEQMSGVYSSVEECISAQTKDVKIFTPEFCQQSFDAAQREHAAMAPRYEDRQDCEKDWGQDHCDATDGAPSNQASGASSTYHGSSVVIINQGYYSPRMSGFWTGVVGDGASSGKGRSFAYPAYTKASGEIFSPAAEESLGAMNARVSKGPNFSTAETAASARATFARGTSFTSGGAGVSEATARGFGFAAVEEGGAHVSSFSAGRPSVGGFGGIGRAFGGISISG